MPGLVRAIIIRGLAKGKGMSNPKPDFVYGIQQDIHPPREHIIFDSLASACLNVAHGLIHPFLTVEGLSCEGPIAIAENRVISVGATMV